jgi:hypothetical protein
MTIPFPGAPFAIDPLIAEAKRRARRRRYLLGVVLVVAATAALVFGLRSWQPSRGGAAVSPTYSGRLYSISDVQRAFAQLAWKLTPAPSRQPGVVVLKARWNEPLQEWDGTPAGTVEVAGRRSAIGAVGPSAGTRMSFANVTVFYYGSGARDNVKGALSALRWGTIEGGKPASHLIISGKSIGPFHIGERRAAVERAFGPGKHGRYMGEVSYFGGQITVGYEFHGSIYNWVTALSTRSPTYHTRAGIHIGSSMQALRRLFVTCTGKSMCYVLAGPWPDALTTQFLLRDGMVSKIAFGYG